MSTGDSYCSRHGFMRLRAENEQLTRECECLSRKVNAAIDDYTEAIRREAALREALKALVERWSVFLSMRHAANELAALLAELKP